MYRTISRPRSTTIGHSSTTSIYPSLNLFFHQKHLDYTTMSNQITIPDLRFEETFTKKLFLSAKKESNDSKIPTSVVIKALLIDQIITPFVQSFAISYAFFYIRPLINFFGHHGFRFGSRLIASVRTVIHSLTYKTYL